MITQLNKKEQKIKEDFFRSVEESRPTGKEVLRVLSFLIKKRW